MICPFCRVDNDRVIDSRTCNDGFAIRRRRECLSCRRRYTTYERAEELAIKVIKKNGSRFPFERQKIKQGLTKACWKRAVSDQQIDEVVTAVELEIYDHYESEVPSREIGDIVMRHLATLDQVAYVRFASVYREFQDVRDFVEELQPMLTESGKPKAESGTTPSPSSFTDV